MPLPLTLQQLSFILLLVPGMTFAQSMQGYNRFNAIFSGGGTTDSMQFFLEGQQSYASLLGSFLNVDGWKTAAGPLVQMHRLLRRICCGGVRQRHLGVKKTASIVSTIPHLHQLQFQFSHVFIFQLGLNCAVANFS